MGFKQDLELGNIYEQRSCKWIEKVKGATCEVSVGKFKPYDIKATKGGEVSLIEVKCDRMASKTGNIAIEFRCSGVGSGITTTGSDFYHYYILPENVMYEIPTDVIRRMIEMKVYERTVRGGDGYRSEMYLFKLGLFEIYRIK